MQQITITQITPQELEVLIENVLRKILNLKDQEPKSKAEPEFITRKEAAKILGITLPTLSDWTKRGIVKGYRIASRVRFKKDEIQNSIIQMQTMNYGRHRRL